MSISINIGERIKELRKSKKLTLTDIAVKTGLSPAYISNIERNQASPTLANLFKIGEALETDIVALMEETPINQGVLVKRKERKKLLQTKSNIIYESITEDSHNVTGICISIDESCYDEILSTGHPDRDELGLQTEGTLILTMNGIDYHMEVGDSIFIERNTPHSYRKTGPGKCVTYWFYAKNTKG